MAMGYPFLGLSIPKVFLRGWHLTPLSTYLLVFARAIFFFVSCVLFCDLLSHLFCYFDCYFCFFDAESKQNCINTPINFKMFPFFVHCVINCFIGKKKKMKKKKEKKRRTPGVFFFRTNSVACCVVTPLFSFESKNTQPNIQQYWNLN